MNELIILDNDKLWTIAHEAADSEGGDIGLNTPLTREHVKRAAFYAARAALQELDIREAMELQKYECVTVHHLDVCDGAILVKAAK